MGCRVKGSGFRDNNVFTPPNVFKANCEHIIIMMMMTTIITIIVIRLKAVGPSLCRIFWYPALTQE